MKIELSIVKISLREGKNVINPIDRGLYANKHVVTLESNSLVGSRYREGAC